MNRTRLECKVDNHGKELITLVHLNRTRLECKENLAKKDFTFLAFE